MDQSSQPVRSALFVDFDNIYIGLSKTEPLAAERFASDPNRWLAWLEKGLPGRTGIQARSILIRRCYPNPDAGFRRFRSFFTSAAFSVIDCPSLTRTGKNSADIYMVMDILDMLNHKTHFDEFIIFSGDSDFMPVLLRLRAHDRRTTTLAIDFMPPAFKAACDLVITEEEFMEEALGITQEESCGSSITGRGRVPVALLREMSSRVYASTCDEGEVAGANLPDILKDFREFRDSSNWLGFGTSQRLAEALVCCEPRLNLVRLNPMMYKLVAKPAVIQQPVVSLPPAQAHDEKKPVKERGHGATDKPVPQPEKAAAAPERETAGKASKAELVRLRGQVIELVREMVSGASSPVLLARASQYVVSRLGPRVLETQWAGQGSFKRLLQSAVELGLMITTQPEPGYVYDPSRHTNPALAGKAESPAAPAETSAEPPAEPASQDAGTYLSGRLPQDYEVEEDDVEGEEEESYEESLPSLEEFIRRVSQVTGAPDLTSQQYALVFQGIMRELQSIARDEKIYNTYQSSKAVSDWCAEQGQPVSRGDLVLIFKGIIFQDGVRFSKRPGSYNTRELGLVVRGNIKALCRRSRLELSEYEEHLLDEWILGGLEDLTENEFQTEETSSLPQDEANQLSPQP